MHLAEPQFESPVESVTPLDFWGRYRIKRVERYLERQKRDIEALLPGLVEGGRGHLSRVARHLVLSGGKRLRPMLMVLAFKASAPQAEPDESLLELAAAAELIHSATLLHDDVIDFSETRRGHPAAWTVWGNAVSVLAGDFVMIRAFQSVRRVGDLRILDELLVTMEEMTGGEMVQLSRRGVVEADMDGYFEVVEKKTAGLFTWALRAGALRGCAAGGGGFDEKTIEALGLYGRHLGVAFQIRDDCLDFEGDPEELGKGVLTDVSEGKITLPLLYAIREDPTLAVDLRKGIEAMENGGGLPEGLGEAVRIALARTGGLEASRNVVRSETQKAIESLDPLERTPYRDILVETAMQLVERLK